MLEGVFSQRYNGCSRRHELSNVVEISPTVFEAVVNALEKWSLFKMVTVRQIPPICDNADYP